MQDRSEGQADAQADAGARCAADGAQDVLIALGANVSSAQGAPAVTLHEALQALVQSGFSILKVSRFFRTPCFPAGAGPDYVNAAVCASTDLTAQDTLAALHRIEAQFGRERRTRWAARSLDLDLIAWGDAVVPDKATFEQWQGLAPELQAKTAPEQLIVPHPRMHDRAFVLVPLVDIAPDWHHPVIGLSAAQMLAHIPQSEQLSVVPI